MARTGRIVLAFLALAAQLPAKVLNAQAGIDAQRVRVGEQVTVTVQASVDVPHGTPWPDLDLAEGLSVVGKDSSSSSSRSITIVNGTRRDENLVHILFRYRLAAKKPGTYSLSISLSGKPLGQGQIVVEDAPQDVRTTTLLGKRSVYVGQQLPFTWRLTADRPFEVPKFPDIRSALGNGFYSETRDSQQLAVKPATENGKQVGRLDITGNLFPLRSGPQKIPSTSLEYRIVERTGGMDPFEAMRRGLDPFEAMRGRTSVINGTARTEEIRLEVLPVPESGRPSTFQGGVGSFTLQSKLEKTSLRAGDGTTLTIVLEGDGQPQASGTPVWAPPAGIEAYPPQDEWTRTWRNGILWTKLVRKIVLVPRHAGSTPLDSVRFSWWDPEAKKFQQAANGLPTLAVEAAAASALDTTQARFRGGQMLSRWDRLWILFGQFSAVVWTLALVGLGAWRLVVWLLLRRSGDYQVRKGLLHLEKRLAKGSPQLQSPQKTARELRTILGQAMALRLGEEVLACTSQELPSLLQERLGWRDEDAQAVGALSESLQACEFAGHELDPKSAKRVAGALILLRPPKR
ncbi:MAG TPA: BatD family protein [Fibrobacteria bacterium]|nr:BatD family protein [Fibrobacteria bacterium]HOX50420.1 BatD family protein [Fibrobacteria bacterium]